MNRKESNFGGEGLTETELHNAKYGEPFSIRLNDQERKDLDRFKDLTDIPRDGTAVKALMEIGFSVIQCHFSGPKIAKLFIKERQRILK